MNEGEKRSDVVKGVQILLLLLVAVGGYMPAILSDYIWDDDAYVTRNPVLREADGLARIWFVPRSTPQYYPIVHSTFFVEYRLWGLNPLGYHLVNVILHILNSIILWRLLLYFRLPAPFFVALLFAVHPVHVESVAWITERKNVLSGLFYLIRLFAAVRFFGLGPRGERAGEEDRNREGRLWSAYFTALLFFVFALLSKSVTATLPAVIILLIYWRKGRVRVADAGALLPFFFIGVGSGLYTAWLERAHVGASGLEWDWSLLEKCLIAGRALWFYAEKLVWPAKLTFIYPRWSIDAGSWMQLLYPVGVVAATAALWGARRRLGRGPLVALLAFGATLFPALGFFAVFPMRYSFVADHFQYLASIPALILIVALLSSLFRRLIPALRAWTVAQALIVIALLLLTWNQCGMYKDEETLWRATIKKNPRASIAHNNLAVLLMKEGRSDEAEEHVWRAVQLDPRSYEALTAQGSLFLENGMTQKAIESYSKALSIQPRYPEAAYNMGNACRMSGQLEKALEMYRLAFSIRPRYYPPRLNLVLLLLEGGRLVDAERECVAALEIFPQETQFKQTLEMIRNERRSE